MACGAKPAASAVKSSGVRGVGGRGLEFGVRVSRGAVSEFKPYGWGLGFQVWVPGLQFT